MPDDPIVHENCGMLRQLEDSIQLLFLRAGVMIQTEKKERRDG